MASARELANMTEAVSPKPWERRRRGRIQLGAFCLTTSVFNVLAASSG
jgi:hypothetical protein